MCRAVAASSAGKSCAVRRNVLRGPQIGLRRRPTALVASQATSQIVNLGVLCSSERAIEELGDRYLGCRERTCVHEMAHSLHPFFVGHEGRFMAERP